MLLACESRCLKTHYISEISYLKYKNKRLKQVEISAQGVEVKPKHDISPPLFGGDDYKDNSFRNFKAN